MTDEIVYERTEYASITQPIVDRYKRISRQRGSTVVPLDAFGRDASGELPNSHRVEVDSERTVEPDKFAGTDSDGSVGDRIGLGWFGGRDRDE